MTIRLTVAPNVKARLQRCRERTGEPSIQLWFNTDNHIALKLEQLALKTQRSKSSIIEEMVKFALQNLDDGEAEPEQAYSSGQTQRVVLRMTDAHEPTYAEIAEQSLKRFKGPNYDDMGQDDSIEARAIRNSHGVPGVIVSGVRR